MTQSNSFFRTAFCLGSVLCLAACASKPVVVKGDTHTSLPTNSVVLIDPTTDDGMLPAIGEGLSKGAVTIYSLDGAGAAIPVRSADAILTPATVNPQRIQSPMIDLKAPAKMEGASDPRVTVFSVDSGAPINAKPEPEILTPMPTLMPPVSAQPTPLQSPFGKDGQVVAKPVSPPPPPVNRTVTGVGSRAVTIDNLMAAEPTPAAQSTTKKSRPPRGMTY